MIIPSEILEKIHALPKPALIGISGFGGSGKTTIAQELSVQFNAPIVGVDSFMIDRNMTDYDSWNIMDFERLEKEILISFTNNINPIVYGHFDWASNGIVESREVDHDGYLIVEGVGLFRSELMKYFSYTIWIDCPIEEAIERGKNRDRETHNNPQDQFWDGVWKKNDEEYFETIKTFKIDSIIKN